MLEAPDSRRQPNGDLASLQTAPKNPLSAEGQGHRPRAGGLSRWHWLLAVTAVGTVVCHWRGIAGGVDLTDPSDYTADKGDRTVQRMPDLVDGQRSYRARHARTLTLRKSLASALPG